MTGNRSVRRAVQVLALLASEEAKGGLTLSEISDALDIPKASTFDIVHALRSTHFLQENKRRFSIGFMAREIGDAYQAQTDLYDIARGTLKHLAEKTGLSTSLVLYDRSTLNYTLQCHPAGKVLVPAFEGGTSFLHAAASGKIMLAFMGEAKRSKIISKLTFQKITAKTLTSKQELEVELQKVLDQGYAVDNGEYEELLTCVSAPLFINKKLTAAITISGVLPDETRIPAMAQYVKEACGDIAQKLTKKRS